MATEVGSMMSIWAPAGPEPSPANKPTAGDSKRAKPSRRGKRSGNKSSATRALDDVPGTLKSSSPPKDKGAPVNSSSIDETRSDAPAVSAPARSPPVRSKQPASTTAASNRSGKRPKRRGKGFARNAQQESSSTAVAETLTETKAESLSLSSSSISLPVTPMLTSAVPQPRNTNAGPQAAVNDAGDSSIVAAPKPQSLAVEAVNIRPYTPSTHSHIDWADDDDEGLPDLDEWTIPPARSAGLRPPSTAESMRSPLSSEMPSSSTEATPVEPNAPIGSPLEKVTSQVEALSLDPPLTQPEPQPRVLELNGEAVNTSTEQQPIAIPPAQTSDIDVPPTSLATWQHGAGGPDRLNVSTSLPPASRRNPSARSRREDGLNRRRGGHSRTTHAHSTTRPIISSVALSQLTKSLSGGTRQHRAGDPRPSGESSPAMAGAGGSE